MSGAKLEIQWSPNHPNKFITWGTEIYLYEVNDLKDISTPCAKLSDTVGASLLATNSNHHYVKCVDIYPQSEPDILLAIGQANGKVVLTTFGPSRFDSLGLAGKELVPRHDRQCNTVQWNPIESNLIAAGLDKYRSDHSVLLWDIMKCPFAGDSNGGRLGLAGSATSHHHHNVAPAVELARPIAEIGVSETAHSLSWFSSQSRTMAVGMNLKQLKIIDLRDSNKVVNSTATKAVFGLSVDSHNDRHLASFVDNQITVWDTRNFEKPILTLTQNKTVLKILWCPTRNNLLSSLQKDSSLLHLHDIQHTVVGNDEVEPSVLERSVVPGSPHNITSFSWHPVDENRLLTIALSGSIIDYAVFERITLNWAPNSNMVWTHGRKTLKLINYQNTIYDSINDISVKIKYRALADYGLKPKLCKNGELADDLMLKDLWDWLYLSKCLVEDGIIRESTSKHPGVRSVLKFDSSPSNGVNGNTSAKSEVTPAVWPDLINSSSHSSTKIYRSEDRDRAIYLCGWKDDKDVNSLKFLEKIEMDNNYARAATIAVFNLKVRLAIEILGRGAEKNKNNSNLNIVAMALSGFTDDKNSMWRHLCQTTKAQLKDPYLRAMFAFLTCDNDSYEHVLNEHEVFVRDRVAFACMYLSDNKLSDFLKNITTKLTEEGNLAGLLLTGTNVDGLNVLQKYLDHTGDVQSVSLIAIRAFPTNLFQDSVIQEWITSYRTLLDAWHLWNQRALFDIELSSCSPADKPPQQVYVSCNFCGKSISAYMQGLNRGRGSFARLGATSNKLKLSSCPNCRKPLPRCAICLMHMGTASGCPSYSEIGGRSEIDNSKMVEYSSWFTWCQSCRHGGHAAHMTHWFKDHSECPVTSCSCRCFSVDMC